MTSPFRSALCAAALAATMSSVTALASGTDDAAVVAALDTQYQAAVAANDATAMDRILADDFSLVTGRGQAYSKADLLGSARDKTYIYERQEEMPGTQKVRLYGDTAVVTALLWIKYRHAGEAADYKLWFSDVYVRRHEGWRYVFGQAAQRLEPEKK